MTDLPEHTGLVDALDAFVDVLDDPDHTDDAANTAGQRVLDETDAAIMQTSGDPSPMDVTDKLRHLHAIIPLDESLDEETRIDYSNALWLLLEDTLARRRDQANLN